MAIIPLSGTNENARAVSKRTGIQHQRATLELPIDHFLLHYFQ